MTGMLRLRAVSPGWRTLALAGLLALLLGLGACAADESSGGLGNLPGKDVGESDAADVSGVDDTSTDTGGLPDAGDDAEQDTGTTEPDGATDTGLSPDAGKDVTEPEDTSTDAGTKPECEAAADCAGKVGVLGDCDEAACVDGKCVKQTLPAPTCCVAAADCNDGNACTTDSCPTKGGVCAYVSDPACCEDTGSYLDAGFEGGAAQGFTVIDTDDVASVTWSLTNTNAHDGSWSWYFGNPACKTYYGGGLDASCVPTDDFLTDNKLASGVLQSPDIPLPAGGVYHLSWRIWSETEALDDPTLPECKPGGPLTCYNPGFETFVDALTVYVDDGVTKSVLWNSASLNKKLIIEEPGGPGTPVFLKTTDGKFALIAADLSPWAGKTIRLQFSFAGSEEFLPSWFLRGKLPEGIYVDNVRVASGCGAKTCTNDNACKSAEACVEQGCTKMSNTSGGVCFWEPDKACKLCPGGTAAECSDGDECTTDACKAGACTNTVIAGCCKAAELSKTGFEAAVLPGGWAATGSGASKWHTSKGNPFAGAWSLWFGNDATGTYDDPGKTPKGSISSAPIVIPTTAQASIASFQLYLSTEWNAGDPPAYDDPVYYDILIVDVLDAATGAPLPFTPAPGSVSPYFWDSYAIGGTTAKPGAPIYKPVTLNLTAFKGKTVKLRFTFDAGDSSSNSHGGVHIDQLLVQTTCGAKICQTVADCDPPASECEVVDCTGGLCTKAAAGEACCATSADCDDGNPCTIDTCSANACSSVDSGNPACCFAQSTLIDGFEDDFGEWAFFGDGAVGWSFLQGESTAHAGDGALYFGNPATLTYAAGSSAVQGVAISPEMAVPSGGTSVLSFWLKLSTEFDENPWFDVFPIDRLTLTAIPLDGASVPLWDSSAVKGTTAGDWKAVDVNLSAVKGKTVRLQFEFDSFDGTDNAWLGALIDELSLSVVCGTAPACFNDNDCPDDGDPCTIEYCAAGKCAATQSNEGACCVPSEAALETFDVGVQGSLGAFTVDAFQCASGDPGAECTGSAAAPVKWQVGSAQSHSGKFALYFGAPSTGSYNDAGKRVYGFATSGPLTLDADADATLDLWTWVDVEPWSPFLPSLDRYEIAVVGADDEETVVWAKSELGEDASAYGTWTHVTVPLDNWAGQEIRVRFTFDSDDGLGNSGLGIFADDVRIIQGCAL